MPINSELGSTTAIDYPEGDSSFAAIKLPMNVGHLHLSQLANVGMIIARLQPIDTCGAVIEKVEYYPEIRLIVNVLEDENDHSLTRCILNSLTRPRHAKAHKNNWSTAHNLDYIKF